MDNIELYLNSLIMRVQSKEELFKEDFENILYIIYNKDKNSLLIQSLLDVLLYNYFLNKEEEDILSEQIDSLTNLKVKENFDNYVE